jgi:hypothetical protein
MTPGTKLGSYEILAAIGAGGMGKMPSGGGRYRQATNEPEDTGWAFEEYQPANFPSS